MALVKINRIYRIQVCSADLFIRTARCNVTLNVYDDDDDDARQLTCSSGRPGVARFFARC